MDFKTERKGLEKKFYELCFPVVTELGYELYDLQYLAGGQTLRLFIENPETKTAVLDDCAAVDRALSEPIDHAEWVPESLVLEVSSPGLFRPLRTLEHFERTIGENICLHLNQKLELLLEASSRSEAKSIELPKKMKSEKKLIANLVNVVEDGLEVRLDTGKDRESDNSIVWIGFENIKKANLETNIDL